MEISYIDYQGKAFWCYDDFLRIWLYHFVKRASLDGQINEWKKPLIDHWTFEYKVNSSGNMFLELDRFIDTSEKRLWLWNYISKTNIDLQKIGTVLSKECLKGLHIFGPVINNDTDVADVVKVGDLLLKLLNNQIRWTRENWEEPVFEKWQEYGN